jgi:hypothetical protein
LTGADHVAGGVVEAGGLKLRERREVASLQLELWPSRLLAVPVALFTFLWLRFLWRWYALILLASLREARGFLLVFGLPFFAAGVSLIATSARLVLGRTIIRLDALRLSVGEVMSVSLHRPSLLVPTSQIVDFIAECSADLDDDHEIDAWQVRARYADGTSQVLPLPVRTLREADDIARRLGRGLGQLRQPLGYRGSAAASHDGADSPESIT